MLKVHVNFLKLKNGKQQKAKIKKYEKTFPILKGYNEKQERTI